MKKHEVIVHSVPFDQMDVTQRATEFHKEESSNNYYFLFLRLKS